MRAHAILKLILGLSVPLAACDNEVDVVDDGAGGDGAGDTGAGASGAGEPQGAGGEGGSPPGEADVTGVSAPTRTSIEIRVEGDLSTAPTDPAAFVVTSDFGSLEISAVAVNSGAGTIELTTLNQKLGVSYELLIASPTSKLDQEGGTFLSADTAKLWATDLQTGQDYEVIASRVGIGENLVLYAADDVVAGDIEETIQIFDEQIFPIETALINPPGDIDDNGKIVLLGLDGHGQYGGYFSPINAFPAEQAEEWGLHSNEMEMVYLSVADIGGFDPYHVVPHEFSHLLYNETHEFWEEDWPYHNEGLAECAVHAVHGSNQIAPQVYVNSSELTDGMSLVQWEYANYDQYAQAYVFWTYVASRLGGVSGYEQLYDLTGNPFELNELFVDELGQSFADVQMDMMTAAWVQAPAGSYGFNGMLTLPGQPGSMGLGNVPGLTPYEGVFLTGAQSDVTPAGQGPNIRVRGIDAAGNVDDAVPFSSVGGALLVLNALQEPEQTTPQPAGTFPQAMPAPSSLKPLAKMRDRAWKHPPPIKPANKRLIEKWRAATRE
jgi:hypothetical protein